MLQDWKVVTLDKRTKETELKKKIDGGKNKQSHLINANKLEMDINNPDKEVDFKLTKISKGDALKIQQGRLKMKLTQENLAKKLNINKSIIKSYEDGTAILDNQILLARIRQVLNIPKSTTKKS